MTPADTVAEMERVTYYLEFDSPERTEGALDFALSCHNDRIGWDTVYDVRKNHNPCCLEIDIWHPRHDTPQHLVEQFGATRVTRDNVELWHAS